jgi:hypothetical protein
MFALRHMRSCVLNGKRYYSGQGLGRLDGCNLHWCEGGQIMSTLMACRPWGESCHDRETATRKALAWASGEGSQDSVVTQAALGVEEAQLSWDVRVKITAPQIGDQERRIRVSKPDCWAEMVPPSAPAITDDGVNTKTVRPRRHKPK